MRKKERPCVYGGCINRPPPKCFVWLHWCPFSSAAPKPAASPLYHPLCSPPVCVTAAWSTEARCLTSDSLQFKVKPPFHLVFSTVTIGRWLCSEKLAQFVYFWSIIYLTLCSFVSFFLCARILPKHCEQLWELLRFYQLLTGSVAFTSCWQLRQLLPAVHSFKNVASCRQLWLLLTAVDSFDKVASCRQLWQICQLSTTFSACSSC